MWQYYWLGQETYQAYRALVTDVRIKYNISNPFRFSNLEVPDHWFFPWPENVQTAAVWLLFAAVLFFWIYKRINTSTVYGCASLGSAIMGSSLLFGFQTAFPRPVFLLLMFVSLTILLGCWSTFLTVLAVDKLPYFGCPDKYLLDDKSGYPRQYIPYVIGGFFVVLLWLCSFDVSHFIKASMLHKDDTLFYTILLMALFTGVFGNAALPFVTLDRMQLDGTYVKIIEPLLKVNGPARRLELIFGIIALCALYAVVAMILNKGLSGADFVGVLLIGGIGMTIIHAEITRSSKVAVVNIKKERGLWN